MHRRLFGMLATILCGAALVSCDDCTGPNPLATRSGAAAALAPAW
jgi:hypothetical protein